MSDPLPLDGTVVVVGAALAGLRAAETLRADGFRGRLVMVGDEQHFPYDRPPLSKQILNGKWPPEKAMLADRIKLDELRIEQCFGHRATALDAAARKVEIDDGTVLQADGVVIATGSHPRHLPDTHGVRDVMVLRTLDDSTRLRDRLAEIGPGARLVVIGAGFIGAEVASTAADQGCAVTVIEALDVPLEPIVGAMVGAACGALYAAHNVDLRTGTGVVSVTNHDGSVVVGLTDDSVIEADLVVVGIGVTPAVDWLDGSGMTIDNGVVCDHALFAADGVVAAGDVARWQWRHHGSEEMVRIEHWQVAAEEGVAAGRSLLAGRKQAVAFDPVPYFWSDQFGLRIQVLGRPGPDDEVAVVDGSIDEGKYVALYGRAGRLRAVLGVSKPRQLMGFRPLLVDGASWDDALAHLGA